MARLVYQDFDDFADGIQGVDGRFVPTARATGEWWIERATIGPLVLQQLQIGAAATFAGDGAEHWASLWIPLSDPRALRVDGHALDASTALLVCGRQPFTVSSPALSRWASVAFAESMLSDGSLGELTHLILEPGLGATRIHVDESLLRRLQDAVVRHCDEGDPVLIGSPQTTAGEEEVLDCLKHVLERGAPVVEKHIGRPQVSRTQVIARCLELIDANESQPLFIHDLCAAAQVSERTLRNIFQEYFGVGPMRLLKVRQLREIRSALLRADPITGTVTSIAAQFGVWDFSLFARNYRALYGVSPSQTLRGPRARNQETGSEFESTPTWIGFAARRFTPASQRAFADERAAGESR
jgi:AraC family transcriptional regulator, ethanolamine operon transcriptional activator